VDLILVGGPAKARDLPGLGQVIMRYQWEAQRLGVGVRAAFTTTTPQHVIDFVAGHIGAGNILLFEE
jgi:hypothetical protein